MACTIFLTILYVIGIGRGIVQALVASGEFQGILLTYNSNQAAAEAFRQELETSHPEGDLRVRITGGDLADSKARDAIFDCFDQEFAETTSDLCCMVHNAGQYAGVTSDNAQGLAAPEGGGKKFGDGTLLVDDDDDNSSSTGKVNFEYMQYYQKLYSEAYVDLCERSLVRMKQAHARAAAAAAAAAAAGDESSNNAYRGCLIGISAPGCNANYKISAGYDMPGSGKCVMEFANRYYALRAAPYNINANVVIPGITRSDAWQKVAEQRGSNREAMFNQMKGMVPMGQIVEAQELGSVIAFLASTAGGGRLMTGLSLRVDGGLHLK
jgi:NAD(P)-dependent dehydrogenase (short-subunit alcohol dehydrogenase family)